VISTAGWLLGGLKPLPLLPLVLLVLLLVVVLFGLESLAAATKRRQRAANDAKGPVHVGESQRVREPKKARDRGGEGVRLSHKAEAALQRAKKQDSVTEQHCTARHSTASLWLQALCMGPHCFVPTCFGPLRTLLLLLPAPADVLHPAVAKQPQAGRPRCMEQRHKPSSPAGICCWQHRHQVQQRQGHCVAKTAAQFDQQRQG
jgi:hypothetical protein